jgi:hypothetical protein
MDAEEVIRSRKTPPMTKAFTTLPRHTSAHNSAGLISLPDAIVSRISNQLVWAPRKVMQSTLITYLPMSYRLQQPLYLQLGYHAVPCPCTQCTSSVNARDRATLTVKEAHAKQRYVASDV